MTNSNNRTLGGGGNSEGNASRQQLLSGTTVRQQLGKRRKNKGKKIQNKSASPTNSVSSSQSGSDSNNYFNGRSNQQSYLNYNPRSSHQQYNYSNGINIQFHRSSPGGLSATSSASSSPPNASLFAGSKCFDAPPPNALPRPPVHWFSCGVVSSQQSDDDLSHNLKLMLNIDDDLLLNSPICITDSSTIMTF